MCTQVNEDDFITIHHELGHTYYQMLYSQNEKNETLEYEFRDGANPAFHEAVGDVMSLSVQSEGHLKDIGLMDKNAPSNKETEINFLLKSAMEKLAFLPFGYLMDRWMWDVYSGKISPSEYNNAWWKLRNSVQGVVPPDEEDRSNMFDPGAKFHIPNDVSYIRYFFAHILQFTFHESACRAAGYTEEFHKCTIYKSKDAGKLLGDMLKLGRSRKWTDALKMVTGSEKMSSKSIGAYYKTLIDWLKDYRSQNEYGIGWTNAKDFIDRYNKEVPKFG
jgi:peptidyl-dipeptidase A